MTGCTSFLLDDSMLHLGMMDVFPHLGVTSEAELLAIGTEHQTLSPAVRIVARRTHTESHRAMKILGVRWLSVALVA